MASIAQGAFRPFTRSYRYMQRQAHENPVIFYACILGAIGPIAVVVVPPIRKSYGYVNTPRPPTTYPLPNRKRDPELKGYDDEE